MSKIPAALVVLAITVSGCNQASGGPTAGAGSVTGSAPASPSPAPSVVAAAEETEAPQPPVEFSGRILCGPPVRSGPEESLEVGDDGMVLTRYRRGAWRQTVTMSDPRLEGTVYHTFEGDDYRAAGAEEGPGVFAATHRIENEEGAWESLGIGGSYLDGTAIGDSEHAPGVFVGEGAYEGMIAIFESTPLEGACGAEVRGVIFDGAPVPEPYKPE